VPAGVGAQENLETDRLISGPDGLDRYNGTAMEEAKQSGDRAFKNQDYSEAVFLYSEALKLPEADGENLRAKIHANLSAAYANMKNANKALTEADKAICIDPTYARAYLRRGNALEQLKRLDAAMQAYRTGASIDSNDRALQTATQQLQHNIDKQKEQKPTAAAPETEEHEATKLKEAGNKLFKDKEFKQASDMYTKAILLAEGTTFSDLHILYSNRSLCHLKQELTAEAEADADRCVQLQPNWATGYSRRGDALRKGGDHHSAREAYLAGLKLSPTNAALQDAVKAEDAALGLEDAPSDEQADPEAEIDLYALLGVTKEANEEAINKGYRKEARKWHPDKNPGDLLAKQKTREINQAHDILTNPTKRRAYDKAGMQGLVLVDQLGEEGYEQIERMEPYLPAILCCLCLFSIPTLCFCCCCCCCCGKLRSQPEECDEYDEAAAYEDLDHDNEETDEEEIDETTDSLKPPGSRSGM